MIGIYRILTEQKLVQVTRRNKVVGYIHETSLDLSNKIASFDALSWNEKQLVLSRNRHRIYRRHECIHCGSDLFLAGSKTGKVKVSCGQDCGQSYRLFSQRLDMILTSDEFPKRIKIFAEYCLIQMIFRTPTKKLNEQLKNACRWKPEVIEVKSR